MLTSFYFCMINMELVGFEEGIGSQNNPLNLKYKCNARKTASFFLDYVYTRWISGVFDSLAAETQKKYCLFLNHALCVAVIIVHVILICQLGRKKMKWELLHICPFWHYPNCSSALASQKAHQPLWFAIITKFNRSKPNCTKQCHWQFFVCVLFLIK